MAHGIYTTLNLNHNSIINVVLDPRTDFPVSKVEGQMVYRTDLSQLFYWDNSAGLWRTWGVIISTPSADSAMTSDATTTPGTIILRVNYDNATLGVNAQGQLIVKTGGITDTQLAANSVTTVKIMNGAVALDKIEAIPTMTVIGRLLPGTGPVSTIPILDEDSMGSNSDSALATQQSIKTYVDSKLGIYGNIEGDYNASTAGGIFPVPMIGVTKKGSMWRIIGGKGIIQGQPVDSGDILIAIINGASQTNSAHWWIIEGNRSVATETQEGIARIATQAEANSFLSDETIITPKKLGAILSNLPSDQQYAETIGNSVLLIFDILHNLGTPYPKVNIQEEGTGDIVYVETKTLGINSIRLTFAVAPTDNQFTVIVKQ